MDDEDDKVRRNLVAFSTTLLAAAWIDISPAQILERLGLGMPTAVSAWLPVDAAV